MNSGNTTLMSASPRLLCSIHREWFSAIPLNAAMCMLTKKKYIGFPITFRTPPSQLYAASSLGHFYRSTKNIFIEVDEQAFDAAINIAEQQDEIEKEQSDAYHSMLLAHLIKYSNHPIIFETSRAEPYYLGSELKQLNMRFDTMFNSRFSQAYGKYISPNQPAHRRYYCEVFFTAPVMIRSLLLRSRAYFYGHDLTTLFRSNLYNR